MRKRRIDELRAQAESASREIFVDSQAPIARYFNSTRTILAKAQAYHAEGRTAEAYCLYWRAATFYLERVKKHARYAHSSSAQLKAVCDRDMARALETMVQLNAELLRAEDVGGADGADDGDGAAAVAGAAAAAASAPPAPGAYGAPALGTAAGALAASTPPPLAAVQAALRDFGAGLGGADGGASGGRYGRQPAAAAAYPALPSAASPAAPPLPSAPPLAPYAPPPVAPPALAAPAARAPLPLALGGATLADGYRHDDRGGSYGGDGGDGYGYGARAPAGRPAPPAHHPVVVPPLVPPPLAYGGAAVATPQPPPPPPFAFGGAAVGFAVPPPLAPAEFASYAPAAQPLTSRVQPPSAPPAPGARAADGWAAPSQPRAGALRTLRLPADLSSRFLELARPNTLRNVETCGVLAGAFVGSELLASHVLIPEQTGSSDSCATTEDGESALCGYQLAHELITLGWVHTHPSQTCFFSSVDLHTQCGYQSMLDEAVGIVLAPRAAPSVGIFRLTTPGGLGEVQCCRERGFHPQHQRNGAGAGNGVYSESAHVVLSEDVRAQIVDLRARRPG